MRDMHSSIFMPLESIHFMCLAGAGANILRGVAGAGVLAIYDQ